jgi:hypothetical protein
MGYPFSRKPRCAPLMQAPRGTAFYGGLRLDVLRGGGDRGGVGVPDAAEVHELDYGPPVGGGGESLEQVTKIGAGVGARVTGWI